MILIIDRFHSSNISYSVEYGIDQETIIFKNVWYMFFQGDDFNFPALDKFVTNIIDLKYSVLHMKDNIIKNDDDLATLLHYRLKYGNESIQLIEFGKRLF